MDFCEKVWKQFYDKFFYLILFFVSMYLSNTSNLKQDMTQGQFFKQITTGFNSEFSFS